ncbi:MAG TPA: hypothetical protein VNH22_07235 [Blastocatellia bacterium]|jgi:uncharacterized delta-60 repeat protein|nr:hypothetical protein [Blastocatellia bacterium]
MLNAMRHILRPGDSAARLSRKLLALAVILLFLCWPVPRRVRAAAGDLDPSFGAGGLVVTDFFGNVDFGEALLIQPDGRLIAVGSVDIGTPDANFGLVRYNVDGSLDPSFGSGGKVVTDFFGSVDFAFDALLQPDGKIVVAGQVLTPPSNVDFAVARYNSDGSLDLSFGIGGKATLDFSSGSEDVRAVMLQPDGKIVVAGFVDTGGGNTDFALARFNADGSLDTSFGIGGKVTTDFFGSHDQAFAASIQADGKIVLAGGTTNNSRLSPMFALARYNSDGSLDSSFGSGGKVTTEFGFSSVIFDLVIQPDGKIIAGGTGFPEGSFESDFALARYNADGTLDATFDEDGKATVHPPGRGGSIRALALQENGKIVAAGSTTVPVGSDLDIAVARFNSDGSIDSSFGTNGVVTTNFVGNGSDPQEDLDTAEAVAIQADGKIVVAGITMSSDGNYDFILARYFGDEVSAFDLCLQDESNGYVLELNLTTGDYKFTECRSGLVIEGTGAVSRRGNVTTLQDGASDRRVIVRINTDLTRGTAAIHSFSSRATFTINDRSIADNTCSCR